MIHVPFIKKLFLFITCLCSRITMNWLGFFSFHCKNKKMLEWLTRKQAKHIWIIKDRSPGTYIWIDYRRKHWLSWIGGISWWIKLWQTFIDEPDKPYHMNVYCHTYINWIRVQIREAILCPSFCVLCIYLYILLWKCYENAYIYSVLLIFHVSYNKEKCTFKRTVFFFIDIVTLSQCILRYKSI